jgi:hypothetical protein
VDQVMITSPDPDRFSSSFLAGSQAWRIESGAAYPLTS